MAARAHMRCIYCMPHTHAYRIRVCRLERCSATHCLLVGLLNSQCRRQALQATTTPADAYDIEPGQEPHRPGDSRIAGRAWRRSAARSKWQLQPGPRWLGKWPLGPGRLAQSRRARNSRSSVAWSRRMLGKCRSNLLWSRDMIERRGFE